MTHVCARILFGSMITLWMCSPEATATAINRKVPDQYLLYEQVSSALRTGHAVIYTVPASTGSARPLPLSAPVEWSKNCLTAPPISELGQRQARAVARGLLWLAAPLGAVSSSEDCGAMTTATFIKANPTLLVRITEELNPPEIQRQSGLIDEVIREHLSAYFNIRWANHTALIVGHRQVETTTIHPVMNDLAAGETAIFLVPKEYQFEFVAKLNWIQWEEMTKYLAPQSQKKAGASRKSQK